MIVFLCINTGVVFISGAIQANQLSGFSKIKVCQVINWIVEKGGIRISQIVYTTYVNDSQLMSENVTTPVEKLGR